MKELAVYMFQYKKCQAHNEIIALSLKCIHDKEASPFLSGFLSDY